MKIKDGVLIEVTPTEAEGHFIIPDIVKEIGDYAFSKCFDLISVTIPDGVTSIGRSAFCCCFNLISVTIPNSVTSIGWSAFSYCLALKSITIPDSVTSIGMYAFSYCSGLTGVTIGNGVTSIENQAFYGCSGLTSITIGNSVTYIGHRAFSYCINLKSITIPDSVTRIENQAFLCCSSLTSITIGNGVTSIGLYAFERCVKLKSKVANYKAFRITPSGELQGRRDKIYREGHRSFVKGELDFGFNGIHYCTNLFEVFDYYSEELDKDIAIYECDVSDENIADKRTSKHCARWIIPRKRLYREDIIRILNGGELRMPRYIDVEREIKEIETVLDEKRRAGDDERNIGFYALMQVAEKLRNAPTADVINAVHAHWIVHERADFEGGTIIPLFECSNCHFRARPGAVGKYCLECGAKIDREAMEYGN